ncbi:hypothetical protein GCM10010123_06610 [Pilimelia anulata]|uniref:Uncharacterized protein n=1 Tax=Pilimelia anulata TaxID=53371 RepID=A0A8J3B4B5_9ACTN|nr:hypothetical protein [Pilimelia anulata]GGJ79323.1 hypothetical protein GCM10010123_06610 [Pilimelia anulata]
MGGFIKRLLLSALAGRLQRAAYRRGGHPAVGGLLRAAERHLSARARGHGHYRRRRW